MQVIYKQVMSCLLTPLAENEKLGLTQLIDVFFETFMITYTDIHTPHYPWDATLLLDCNTTKGHNLADF